MSFEIKIVDPTTYPGWNELIAEHDEATIFHTSNWARVLAESYSYRPVYFCVFDRDVLVGVIPIMEVNSVLSGKRGVSLPFSDYCEPLISDGGLFRDLLSEAVSYGKNVGWKYLEIRGGGQYFEDGEDYIDYSVHELDMLGDEEEQFHILRASTKRNIKKAMKLGIETKIMTSLESLREFYRLNCMTRKEHGLPPQPYSFFLRVHENILSDGKGIIILAYKGKQIIAGAVYFHFGRKALYKYGASDKSYQQLRANNLVMWEAIKWFRKNGQETFGFGRTEMENKGLLQFKAGWGTKEGDLKYFRIDPINKLFVKKSSGRSQVYTKIFKKIPVSILTMIGNMTYRHVG